MNTKEKDKQYIAGTYNRFPVEIVRGSGSLVYDENGREYIDMGSGIGVTSFGNADADWKQAVISQLDKFQHMSNLYYTKPCADLAEALCERTGMKKVFFSNSGAEANECAIKAARKYSADKKGEDCYTIITLVNSFHGRTVTTLAATGQDVFHEKFRPLTPGFIHVPANDCEEMKKAVTGGKIAGIMIECVQGEGGVIALDEDFVRCVYELSREYDIPLIVDEVQTGNGRTGRFYSYMHYGIKPDIVSTAKGLAGGLPIGATLLGEKTENVYGSGDHGSTFGGNPVSCAAALSIVKRIDDRLLDDVMLKSRYIFSEFENMPGVKSVSGMGLMIGIETEKPAADIVKACIEQGVLCLTAKNRVRLLPALNIPPELLTKAVNVIKECTGE